MIDTHIQEQKKIEVKVQKNNEEVLRTIENIKASYNNGQYVSAEDKLNNLKKQYPDSKYIEAFEKDYTDLPQKAEADQKEINKKRGIAADKFNNMMLQGYGNGIYNGCEMSKDPIMGVVFVNNSWDVMGKLGKKDLYKTQ
jgi:hypothetical protein